MTSEKIRPIVIGIFRKGDVILVFEGYDPIKEETFYRPLGGGIDFGEHSRQTLIREIHEELGAEITEVRYLGALENVFTYNGQPGHEIIFVYEAAFVDPAFYELPELTGYEDDDSPFRAIWKPLEIFRRGEAPLYPKGLLGLLLVNEDLL